MSSAGTQSWQPQPGIQALHSGDTAYHFTHLSVGTHKTLSTLFETGYDALSPAEIKSAKDEISAFGVSEMPGNTKTALTALLDNGTVCNTGLWVAILWGTSPDRNVARRVLLNRTGSPV